MKHIRNILRTTAFASLLILAGCIEKPNSSDKKTPNNSETTAKDLIFQEIFYAGTFGKEVPTGKNKGKVTILKYEHDDSYIKIYNPTKEVIYLDGYALGSGLLEPTSDPAMYEHEKEKIDKSVAVTAVVMIPGTGTQYPIKPGETVILGANAVNHAKGAGEDDLVTIPSEAINLYEAKFIFGTPDGEVSQWKEENKSAVKMESQIPSKGEDEEVVAFKIPRNGMLCLINLKDATRKADLKKTANSWKITSKQTHGAHTHTNHYIPTATPIPNEWIVDAVTICPVEQFNMNVASKKLEDGWTSIERTLHYDRNMTKDLFGQALYRKHNGNTYEDSNNSTVDFEVKKASLYVKGDANSEE